MLRGSECCLHALEGGAVDERADEGALLERVADLDRAIGGLEAREEVLLDVRVRDYPAQAGAALARGTDRGESDAAHRQVEVGRGGDDRGIVAAELEEAAPGARRHHRGQGLAHAAAPGRTHEAQTRIGRDPLARLAAADHDLEQARGSLAEALERAREEGLAGKGRERGLLRGLPHHGVAADERQRGVPRPHRDREVEGGDDAYGRERVPGLHHAVAGPLGGDGEAVELAREAEGEVADVDHLLHFAAALLEDLAGLEGHQAAERVLGGTELLAEEPHELAAPGCGYRAPAAESRFRFGDLGLDARGRIALHAPKGAPVDRRAHDDVALDGA